MVVASWTATVAAGGCMMFKVEELRSVSVTVSSNTSAYIRSINQRLQNILSELVSSLYLSLLLYCKVSLALS